MVDGALSSSLGRPASSSFTSPADGPALSELPPRDASALVHAVRDRLRRAITVGEIASGTRINQVQVATQLGVSRMPVRAAVADLQAEGLLDPLPGGGAMVRALTAQDLRDVYEVRAALETRAARHVADRVPRAGLDAVTAVLDEHRRLGGISDPVALLELDRRFHMAVLDATGNPTFRRAVVPIWSIVERAMVVMLRDVPGVFERAWVEHSSIAEALESGDADLAETRMRTHLEFAASQLASTLTGTS